MNTTKTIAALFDFDGVIMDTETQYTVFYSGDVFVGHLLLVNVEFGAYFKLGFGLVREILFIDLQ